MGNSNAKKSEQLGMPFGTASNRLRKMLLFDCIQRLNFDVCYHCGELIESIDDLSIEHKEPWLDSDDPAAMFFNLDNVSLSHFRCNSKKGAQRTLTDDQRAEIAVSTLPTKVLVDKYSTCPSWIRRIRREHQNGG